MVLLADDPVSPLHVVQEPQLPSPAERARLREAAGITEDDRVGVLVDV